MPCNQSNSAGLWLAVFLDHAPGLAELFAVDQRRHSRGKSLMSRPCFRKTDFLSHSGVSRRQQPVGSENSAHRVTTRTGLPEALTEADNKANFKAATKAPRY